MCTPCDSTVNNATELFERFDQLYRYMTQSLGKNSIPGLLFGQGRLLRILQEHDGISQKELSRLASLSPPTVAELADKLESASLIERRRDGEDARRLLVYITQDGKTAAADMSCRCEQHLDKLFSALSSDERAQLSFLLTKLSSPDGTVAGTPPTAGKIRRGVRLG